MPEPFEQALPGLGDVPWNLNPAIDEIRERTGVVEDEVNIGRLSPTGLRAELNPYLLRGMSAAPYGIGTGGDDTAKFQQAKAAALTFGINTLYIPPGQYTTSGIAFELSDITQPFRIVLDKGAVITHTADTPVFQAVGSIGSWTPLTSILNSGNRQAFVASGSAANFPVGSWIHVASNDLIPNSSDKIGYLRKVTSLTDTGVTFDANVPRGITPANSAHLAPVTLLPSIEIIGGGQVKHATSTNLQSLIRLVCCYQPLVGIEVGPSGATGASFAHCVGGGTLPEFYVHDLRDDGEGFGYGINCSGSSRGMAFYGLAVKCRHAITSNPGPNIPNSNQHAETENIEVNLTTQDCTNKALDTHRSGWGWVFRPNHIGGVGGGIQIRSDNTHVDGGTINGTNTVGIAVTSDVVVPATINGTRITGTGGGNAPALLLDGPAIVNNVSIFRFTGAGIRVNADRCIINMPTIDGVSAGSLKGIELNSNNNLVVFGRISNVATGIAIATGRTGNQYGTVTYGVGVGTQVTGP